MIIMSDLFESDLEANDEEIKPAESRALFEKSLSNVWGYSELGIEAKKAAMTMLSTKTGMYARIPLVCKANSCPYAEKCQLLNYNLAPLGELCPKETAEIELRYYEYSKEFDLDSASFTDKNLVSELINYDIMLDRQRALLSQEGVLVVDVVTGVSEAGETFTHPEVSKTWEAYERIEKKRNNIYDLMLATRKSKKSDKKSSEESVTEMLSKVMNKDDFIIDVKPDDL